MMLKLWKKETLPPKSLKGPSPTLDMKLRLLIQESSGFSDTLLLGRFSHRLNQFTEFMASCYMRNTFPSTIQLSRCIVLSDSTRWYKGSKNLPNMLEELKRLKGFR